MEKIKSYLISFGQLMLIAHWSYQDYLLTRFKIIYRTLFEHCVHWQCNAFEFWCWFTSKLCVCVFHFPDVTRCSSGVAELVLYHSFHAIASFRINSHANCKKLDSISLFLRPAHIPFLFPWNLSRVELKGFSSLRKSFWNNCSIVHLEKKEENPLLRECTSRTCKLSEYSSNLLSGC